MAGRVASETAAGGLMLAHLVPRWPDRASMMTEVRRSYSGPVLIGEDLMTFDTGDRSVTHAGAVLTLGG